MSSTLLTVIENTARMPLGTLLAPLTEAGLTIRTIRPHAGDPLPTLDQIGAGLVVLGADASAYDNNLGWLPGLRSLLLDAARSGVPTLALGLGAQLLAVAGGGQVTVAAPPGLEAGAVRVFWRPEARTDLVLGAVARAVAEAGVRASVVGAVHVDAVSELPDDAVWLGSSNMYPFQAFRLGSALGLQFHPEATPAQLLDWYDAVDVVAAGGAEVGDPAVLRQQIVDGLAAASERIAAEGVAIAEAFAAQVRCPQRARG